MERKEIINAKRIVVKVGTSSLTYPESGKISIRKMDTLIRQVADLVASGREVIFVTSGAQAVGVSTLNLGAKPKEMSKKQAVASVGQANLMMLYQKLFKEYGINSGQVLITKDVIDNEKRRENAINTFNALLGYKVIPIVNENDTVSTDEIEFGDNDTLSAIVARITQSDLLIILSDIDGLYDDDPNLNDNAKLISKVTRIDDNILGMGKDSKSEFGTGGMFTKIQAAKICTNNGIDMMLANANVEKVIYKIIHGEQIGTLFVKKG